MKLHTWFTPPKTCLTSRNNVHMSVYYTAALAQVEALLSNFFCFGSRCRQGRLCISHTLREDMEIAL